MATIIQLPGKHTALLRDSEELSNRDMKVLRRAAREVGLVGIHLKELGMDEIQAAAEEETDPEVEKAPPTDAENQKALTILTQLSDDEDDKLDLFQRTCAYVRLVEWSLDIPKPTTAEDVDLLPRPIYDALTTEAAKLDLNEDFSMDGAVDPKVTIENSADSEQPLAEATS